MCRDANKSGEAMQARLVSCVTSMLAKSSGEGLEPLAARRKVEQ